MRIPRKVVLLGATVASLALIPAPGALGASKAEQAQNARIKKLSKDLTAAKKVLDSTSDNATTSLTRIGDLDGRLKAIEGGVPTIIKALGDLKDGLTQAGAGLTSLKTLATSTEYGIGQVFIAGSPASGAFLVTPDIPDAVQQAQTTQNFLASAPGDITVKVGVRSAESDGTSASDPAAVCRVTVSSGGKATTSVPNAGLGGAPFYPIGKSPQTSETETSFPFGPISTDVLVDLTTGSNSTSPAGIPQATAGAPYSVSLSCVDTSPSTTDPSA
ncbi:MAG: hypothetical protein QOJ07_2366 [Thermoleophilaceae bacterium]|nr:hypothetical protein [Thermoleophilaceae bacterium]